MGVNKPLDSRFPQWEQSYTQGGTHINSAIDTWQTVVDFSDKRGTMYVRYMINILINAYANLRITIDGVAYPIKAYNKAGGLDGWWIFDFNESVKIEDYCGAANRVRTEFAYYEYTP